MSDVISESPPEIKIGERLPGLLLGGELPAGTAYWDQVIPSQFGDLIFPLGDQYRDGLMRWSTADRKVKITVTHDTGIVCYIFKQQ